MAALKMVPLNLSWGLLLLFSCLLIGACGRSDSPKSTSVSDVDSTDVSTVGIDETLEPVIELYEELLDVLAGVTDEASAEAASGELSRIANRVEDLERRMGDFTQAEAIRAPLWGRFLNLRQEFGNEFNRISADPAAFEAVATEFENLN